MTRLTTVKRCLAFVLIAISSWRPLFAQVAPIQGPVSTNLPAPSKVALRLQNQAAPALRDSSSAGRPSVLRAAPLAPTAAIFAKSGVPGLAALQGAVKALGAEENKSGGAQARQALQVLYGERASKDDLDAPSVAGREGPRWHNQLDKAKIPGLGVDTSAMDLAVRPQDDFFRFVSGTWLKTFEMPADKSRFGAFDNLREKSEYTVKAIIEKTSLDSHATGSDGQRIADLYKSFMNTELIEAKGLKPIEGSLAGIEAIQTKAELGEVFGRALREGVGTPVALGIEQDSKNTAAYITTLGQSGLGLPDRDYYFNEDATSVKIRSKYIEYLTTLFTLAGDDKAEDKAAVVFALEKDLARHHWTKVENRDADKTYNKIDINGLGEMAPGFDWTAYLREAKIRPEETDVIVGQPSYFKGFAKIFDETPLASWKLYMKARALDSASSYLPETFVAAAFEYKERTLRGQPEMRPRWKRGVSLVDGAVGELIGQIYVKENYPASSKAKMERMIENLRAAYAERIQGLDWMGAQTKIKALDKLAKFTPKIGYPDKWRDYSKLNVRAEDLLGNVRRSNIHDYDFMIAKLGSPVDRGEWGMTPQTVNAYYNPAMNEIVFPAAILQGVFFNPEADDAVNYGAIGAVIGHEMGHGFDDEGSKYDGDGMLKAWWTPKDRAEFEARTGKLVEQFNGYAPLPGSRINGALTLGENIGDLAGITVAYEAYRRSLNGVEAPVIEGFTGDQRFFLGWAQVWRSAIREAALEQQLKTDPHSPAEYRVNGVMRNLPSFYEAFGVKEGDKLYLPEKDRVKIW